MGRFARKLCTAALLVVSQPSHSIASPNVELDEPVYEELTTLQALGRLPLYMGGLRPLTERRVHELLASAGSPPTEPADDGFWLRPLRRAKLVLAAMREQERAYSTSVRPRDLVGGVNISCEHREGDPCGDGVGAFTQLDSSAGYGEWVSGSLRLLLVGGTDRYDAQIAVDRGYLLSELGPVAVEVGRDAFSLGPSSRTQLGWGDHAPAIDHVRISTARPIELLPALRANALYALGILREPQRYPGNVVSIIRGQLDIVDRVELGIMQQIQMLGEGAPGLSVGEFLLEHFRRGNASAGADDTSNRRFGGDLAFHVPDLHARFYYALMFEDIRRKRFIDAVRYDADHLFGVEVAALGANHDHAFIVEWHTTGVRSHEHVPRTTGFTNAGNVVGSPLGPDSTSIFAGARINLGWSTLSPWLELTQHSSDTYTFVVDGPISRATRGVTETRYRAGARLRAPLTERLWCEGQLLLEHVESAGFMDGHRDDNFGIVGALVWHPEWRFATSPL